MDFTTRKTVLLRRALQQQNMSSSNLLANKARHALDNYSKCKCKNPTESESTIFFMYISTSRYQGYFQI